MRMNKARYAQNVARARTTSNRIADFDEILDVPPTRVTHYGKVEYRDVTATAEDFAQVLDDAVEEHKDIHLRISMRPSQTDQSIRITLAGRVSERGAEAADTLNKRLASIAVNILDVVTGGGA